MLIIMIFVSVNIVENYKQYNTLLKHYDGIAEYGNYLSFQNYTTSDMSDSEVQSLNAEAFKVWETSSNGIYSSFGCVSGEVVCYNQVNYALVNVNYIEEFKSAFEGLETEEIASLKNEYLYVLVPMSFTDQASVLEDVRNIYQIEASSVVFVQYTEARLPTLSPNVSDEIQSIVNNPPLYILNNYLYEKAGTFWFSSFGTDDSLKFNPHSQSRTNLYEQLLDELENPDYEKILNISNFERIDSKVSNSIDTMKNMIIIYSFSAVFAIVLYFILEYIMTVIIIGDEKKELSIKFMNGYTVQEMALMFFYQNLMILGVGTLFNLLFFGFVLKYSIVYILGFTLIIIIMEMIFTIIFIARHIEKNIMSSLKGDI